MMSGSAHAYWATSEERNHQSIVYDTFSIKLNFSKDPMLMLKILKEAKAEEIMKLPIFGDFGKNGPFPFLWTPVVESKYYYSVEFQL